MMYQAGHEEGEEEIMTFNLATDEIEGCLFDIINDHFSSQITYFKMQQLIMTVQPKLIIWPQTTSQYKETAVMRWITKFQV